MRTPGRDESENHRDGWASIARWYRLQERLEHAPIDAAVSLAGPLNGRRVLDAAAGTGLICRRLLDASVPPPSITAVDASPAMLSRLRRRCGRAVQVMRADLRDLPMADGSVDVAFAGYLLHILDDADRAQVLSELRRVLADDGVLITITPHAPPTLVCAPSARTSCPRAIRPSVSVPQRAQGPSCNPRADPTWTTT